MTPKRGRELTTEELTAYLEGEVTPSEANRIDNELEESSGACRRLATLRQIRDALVEPMAELREVNLVPSLRRAMAQPLPSAAEERQSHRWTVMPWVAAAACVSVIASVAVHYRPVANGELFSGNARGAAPSTDGEFRAKSAGSAAEPTRWAGLQVYRVHHGGRPERVSQTLSGRDSLLFSYTNLGHTDFEYLMIFAVDARGEVRWCHPAYQKQGENPGSIAIRQGEAEVPLPELIRHELVPGPLSFHALFSSRPLRVLEVEALVSGKPPREPLRLPDVVDQVLTVQVEP